MSYLVLSLISGLTGAALSIIIRIELGNTNAVFNNDQLYNRLVTAHAFVIIFFFVIPALVGFFGN
jgi:cytochrome c oxidase subunit 1